MVLGTGSQEQGEALPGLGSAALIPHQPPAVLEQVSKAKDTV